MLRKRIECVMLLFLASVFSCGAMELPQRESSKPIPSPWFNPEFDNKPGVVDLWRALFNVDHEGVECALNAGVSPHSRLFKHPPLAPRATGFAARYGMCRILQILVTRGAIRSEYELDEALRQAKKGGNVLCAQIINEVGPAVKEHQARQKEREDRECRVYLARRGIRLSEQAFMDSHPQRARERCRSLGLDLGWAEQHRQWLGRNFNLDCPSEAEVQGYLMENHLVF